MKNFLIVFSSSLVTILVLFFGFYGYWIYADPRNTCAGCHEIVSSVGTWEYSAHRDIRCSHCHGTALENGIHSLKEKSLMVLTHATRRKQPGDIRMNETQVLEVSDRCSVCHQSEYARWQAGGHSVRYKDIFLDTAHNAAERPGPDCLRCHAMFFQGGIKDLVTPVSIKGPWKLLDKNKVNQPVIPCLACHQVHTENPPLNTFNGNADTAKWSFRNPDYGLYIRSEKLFLRADYLPVPEMFQENSQVKVFQGPGLALCIQCHSPGAFHQAGTHDDRTPTGVHEGLSCLSCHDSHSNDASRSCSTCHPAISNCSLDVMKMNTTYLDSNSPNNIHFVSCNDCHETSFLRMHAARIVREGLKGK